VLNFTVSFFITIANLLVLYLVLKKLLWKPVTKFMDARAKKIKDDFDSAAVMKAQAEEKATRYDELMSGADAEAARLVKEGEDRAKEEAKAILEKAMAEAANARRQAEAAAIRESARAREALSGDIAKLVTEAAARLAGRDLSAARAEDERAAGEIVRELEADRAR
jgi:F-type H+-transporting ATPase subunit b